MQEEKEKKTRTMNNQGSLSLNTYNKLIELLKSNNIDYLEYRHEPVRTSEEAVKTRPGISLSQGAKALIVKIYPTKEFVMLVVPGDKRFDSSLVKKVLNSSELRFATEEEVIKITDGVLPGGVPPFGNLFKIPVFVDPKLLENEKIAFNAGDKGISIIMNPKDWERVVKPKIEKII